ASLVTSTVKGSASWPSARKRLASSSSLDVRRAASATRAPYAARASAVASPMPDDAPVMTATLPSSCLPCVMRALVPCSTCVVHALHVDCRAVAAVDELIEALTNAGLKWGRPATHGAPEIRVKNDAGNEFAVIVLRFSFMVSPQSEAGMVYQRLS